MSAIGKPGVIVITDNGGTWTAGNVQVAVGVTTYTQNYDTNKDTSMTALAAQLAGDPDVISAVYNSTAHTITITPAVKKQLAILLVKMTGFTGTMTWDYDATNGYPNWSSDGAAEIAEPSTGEKATGLIHGTRPPAHWFNYLFQMIRQWTNYVEYALGLCDEGSCSVDVYNNTPAKNITVQWRRRGKNIQLIFPETDSINQGGGQFLLGYAYPLPSHLCPAIEQPLMGMRVYDSSAGLHYCIVLIHANGRIEIFMDASAYPGQWAVVTPVKIYNNVIEYCLP